jgi:hypothetical protein
MASYLQNMKSTTQEKNPTIWKAEIRALFKKVFAFDLLFIGLDMMMGAGIITVILVN